MDSKKLSPKTETYELLKDIPGCKAGTFFVMNDDLPQRLVLAWGADGNCQGGCFAGGSIQFPAVLSKNETWFRRVCVCPYCKSRIGTKRTEIIEEESEF